VQCLGVWALGLADGLEPVRLSGSYYIERERYWRCLRERPNVGLRFEGGHARKTFGAVQESHGIAKASAEGGRSLRPGKSCLTTTRSLRVVLAAVCERVIVVNNTLSAHCESLFVHARHAGRRMLLRRNETLEHRGPTDVFSASMTLNGLQRQASAPRIAGRSTDASTGAKRQHHDHPFVPSRSRPQTAAPDQKEQSLGVLPAFCKPASRLPVSSYPTAPSASASLKAYRFGMLCSATSWLQPLRGYLFMPPYCFEYTTHQE
jgi:hypothetical protein